MQRFYIVGGIPFLTAALLSSLLTALVCSITTSTGFIASASENTYHDRPRPLGGGIAIFMSLLLTIGGGVLFLIYGLSFVGDPIHETVAPFVEGTAWTLDELAYLAAGGTGMFFIGLWDDHSQLSPSTKLFLEVFVAMIVLAGGIQFSLFLESDGFLASTIQFTASLIWVVGLTNSFNLLDNMDGQCAGIAAVLSLSLGLLGFQTGQFFLGAFLFAFTGTLIGFLVFNFPPSRLFAGDSGSLFIGYVLSTSTLLFTFIKPGYHSQVYLSPLILFTVPFYDTSSVLWIRFRKGLPLFEPDTNHFSHRLVERGLSERGALLVTLLLSALTGLFTLIVYQSSETGATLVFIATIILTCVLSLLEQPIYGHGERDE